MRNRKNSIIIALLIAVITFLFFTGNSVISQANQGIREAYIDSLTGDVVLEAVGDVQMNLFGANTPIIDSFFSIPVIPAYDAIMEIVASQPGVAGISSQVSGNAYLELLGIGEPVLLCGVDVSTYFSLFPGIILEEGRFLHKGEYGAMITAERADRIEMLSGQRPLIGTPMLLTSGSDIGFKIREVPLVGIFRYKNPGQIMNEIVIIDPQTVRVLNSIQVAGESDSAEAGNTGLVFVDLDDIFGESFFIENISEEEFSTDILQSFLSEHGTGEEIGGDWNFIVIRLEESVSPAFFISSINKRINNFGVTAVNWRIAAGTSAILMLMVQTLFNAGLFIVSIAGAIAAINILLMAVFRRIREIGTLRAIGASDAYIRSLIYAENFILALIAGFVGVVSGILVLRWINNIEINVSNDLLSSLFGSTVLRIGFLPYVAVLSFVVSLVLAFAASVYPVEAAVRIEPMMAVRRG